MGVPSFFYWIFKNYPHIVHKILDGKMKNEEEIKNIPSIDVYALDLNAIIHPVCQELFKVKKASMMHPKPQKKITTEMIYHAVCEKVDELYKLVRPKKKFIIAIDGCCPIAKQSQQRLRRFKSVKEKNPDEIKQFDSNCISVGTEFLEGFSEYLKRYTKSKIKNGEWSLTEIIISDHKVPGEGEHKIIRLFASKYKDLICLLHSPDADLIMLSLACNHPNLYILRENVYTNVMCKYLFIKVNGERDSLKDVLYSLIRDRYPTKEDCAVDRSDKTNDLNRVSIDFIFLCFFFGNDFFAKIHSLEINTESMKMMIDIYKEFCKPPTKGNSKKENKYLIEYTGNKHEYYKINFKSLSLFIELLSGNEKRFISKKTKTRSEILKDLSMERNTLDVIDEKTGKKEIDFESYRRDFYEQNLFMEGASWKVDRVITQERKIYYKEYFRALSFCLKYYTVGVPDWHYFFPYHYTPFFTDLHEYLRHLDDGELREMEDVKFNLNSPLLPFEQLFSILPVNSFHLLPPFYKGYMETKLIDLYPIDFYIDLEGKKYEHEAVVLLPFSDIKRMKSVCEEIYKNEKFSEREKVRNSFGKTLSYKRKNREDKQ